MLLIQCHNNLLRGGLETELISMIFVLVFLKLVLVIFGLDKRF